MHPNLNWVYVTEPINHSAPAIADDGTIYIGTSRQNSPQSSLYALNSDGTLKWRYQFPSSEEADGSPVIGPSGNIYITTEKYIIEADCSYTLYKFDGQGVLQWTNTYESSVQQNYSPDCTPAVSSTEVLYVSGKISVFAINSSGSLIWTYTPSDNSSKDFITPQIGPSGTIYAHAGLQLHAINPDGSEKWTNNVGGRAVFYSPVAIGTDETIYFGKGAAGVDYDESIYALNSAGTLLWSVSSEGLGISAPPIIGEDGTIYVGTTAKGTIQQDGQSGIFFAINPNGTKKWSYDTSAVLNEIFPDGRGDIYAAAIIDASGTVYFGNEGQILFAMNPDDGSVITSYSMYELSPRSSGSSSFVRNSFSMTTDGKILAADYYHYYATSEAGDIQEGAVYQLDVGGSGLGNTPWPKFQNNNMNTGRSE